MKRFTLAAAMLAVLSLSACGYGTCNTSTQGECISGKTSKNLRTDSMFSRSLRK